MQGSLGQMFVKLGILFSDEGLKRMEGKLKNIGKTMTDFGKKMTLGITVPLAGVGTAAVVMAGRLEQSEAAFTTLLGSVGKAKSLLGELRDFAAHTPFEFAGLQDASRKLLAFGFQAEELIPTMTSVGDAVSGLGGGAEEINSVVRALGQMKAKGKVSAEEMNQLAEIGIAGFQLIADKLGITIPEAMKKSEQGAIDATTGISAILEGLNKKFAGGMESQSKRLIGLFSTLKDNVAISLTELGKTLIETFDLKEVIRNLTDSLQRLVDWFKNLGEGSRKTIVIIAGIITVAPLVVVAFGTMVSAIRACILGVIALKAAIGGPAGLVALLTVTLITGLAAVALHTELMGENFQELKDKATGAVKALKGQVEELKDETSAARKEADALLERYKEISREQAKRAAAAALEAQHRTGASAHPPLEQPLDINKGPLGSIFPPQSDADLAKEKAAAEQRISLLHQQMQAEAAAAEARKKAAAEAAALEAAAAAIVGEARPNLPGDEEFQKLIVSLRDIDAASQVLPEMNEAFDVMAARIATTAEIFGESSPYVIEASRQYDVLKEKATAAANTLLDLEKQNLEGTENWVLTAEALREVQTEMENFDASLQKNLESVGFFEEVWERFKQHLRDIPTLAEQVADMLYNIYNTFSKGVGTAIASAIIYGESLSKAMVGVLKQIGAQVIATLIQIGIQQLLSALIAPVAASTMASSYIAGSTARAGVAAYAAAIEAFGIFGLAIGPALAAGAITTAGGIAQAGGVAGGAAGRAAVLIGGAISGAAKGGIFTRPTITAIAENEPEIALTRTNIRQLGLDAGRGLHLVVNLNGGPIMEYWAEHAQEYLELEGGVE